MVPPIVVEVIQRILVNTGRIHGSEILDALIDHAGGRFVDSYDVERVIDQLGLEPEDINKPAPTHSQRAFLGLQYKRHPGWVAGTKGHYWLRRRVQIPND